MSGKELWEALVQQERERQQFLWREENLAAEQWFFLLAQEVGELAEAILKEAEQPGGAWQSQMESELIHIAAVAAAMWESGKRNAWLPKDGPAAHR